MKNKMKYNVYIQTLKQLMIPAAIIGIICIISSVVNMAVADTESTYETVKIELINMRFAKLSNGQPTAASLAPSLVLFMYVGSAIFTYIAFMHMNKRDASDFYDSLAYSRTKGYVQRILAVLTCQYGIIIITLAVSVISMKVYGITFDWTFIPKLVLSYMASSALIVGVAAIAMSITGNLLFNIIAAFVIFAVPRYILFTIDRMILGYVSDLFVDISKFGIFLNPVYNIPTAVILDISGIWEFYGVAETLIHPGAIAYTFVLGALYLGIGFVLMKTRKSELAGRGTNKKALGHALCVLAVTPLIIYAFYSLVKMGVFNLQVTSAKEKCITFAGAGLLLFLIAEFLLSRDFKKTLKAVPIFIAASIVSFGFIYTTREIGGAVSSNIPESSEVEYVKIDQNYNVIYEYNSLYRYTDALTKEIEFNDEELISLLLDSLQDTITEYDIKRSGVIQYLNNDSVYCEFKLKNGKSVYRYLNIYENNFSRIKELILANDEYKAYAYSLPDTDDLTQIISFYGTHFADAEGNITGTDIYELFVDDYNAADEETKTEIISRSNSTFSYSDIYYNGVYLVNDYNYLSSFTVLGKINGLRFSKTCYVSSNVPETAKTYIEYINSKTVTETLKGIEAIKEDSEDSTIIYVNINFLNAEFIDASSDPEFTLYFTKGDEARSTITQEELNEVLDMFKEENFSDVSMDLPLVEIMITSQNSDYYIINSDSSFANITDEQARILYDIYLKTLQ